MPREYAPVLPVVKQRALDDGCGLASIEGAGDELRLGHRNLRFPNTF